MIDIILIFGILTLVVFLRSRSIINMGIWIFNAIFTSLYILEYISNVDLIFYVFIFQIIGIGITIVFGSGND